MPSKSARIDGATWERYRREITALYFSPGGSLPKTMEEMKKRYGFEASKSQYTTKLNAWGIKKYANSDIWLFVDQKQRKRKLNEGKDTEFRIHGIKRSRSDIEREIARNVTHTSRLQLLEDIPTPEGVDVFTPGAEASSVSLLLREVVIDNLPLFQMQRGIETLMLRIMKENHQPLSMHALLRRLPNSQIYDLNGPQLAAKLLQMALGDTVQWENANSGLPLGSINAIPRLILDEDSEPVSLAAYFPPEDTKNSVVSSSSTFDMPRISPRIIAELIAVQRFLQYFIALTNNDVLGQKRIFQVVDWMLKHIDPSFFPYFLSIKSIAVKIFMRKIFPAVVNSGNTKVAKEIIDRKIDTSNPPKSLPSLCFPILPRECMSIAVGNGDYQMVELLLKVGFPTQISEPIHIIRKKWLPWETGNLEVLLRLLAFGADPECLIEGKERGFPLVDAAKTGNLKAVTMLITAGAGINVCVPSHFGTPLQAAVNFEHLEVAKYLIDSGADVDAPYGTQYLTLTDKLSVSRHMNDSEACAFKTPIQIACERNNFSLVEMLLSHGAHVDFSPLSRVITDNPMAATVYRGSDPHRDDLAVYLPNYEKMRFQTALQFTVKNRNMFLVRRLLSKGADPNARVIPNRGDTPLQMSIRLNYPEISQVLIEIGADVNDTPGRINGRTAMQAAAESGNFQIAELLIRRNANLNAPAGYSQGLTALQAAITHRHPLMVEFLLTLGADINAPPAPREGLTAIGAAVKVGDLKMIEYIMLQGASLKSLTPGSAILAAISHKNLPMLEFLVAHAGNNINKPEDDKGIPPIVAAAKAKWVDGVGCLLKTGADVNSFYYDYGACRDNISLLNWAIINDDLKMTDLLLQHDADLQYPFSKTPFNDALCQAMVYQRCRIIISLLDKYAHSGLIYFHNDTLAMAVKYGRTGTEILRMILTAVSMLPKSLRESQIRNAWNKLSENLVDIGEDLAIEVTKQLLNAGAKINSKTISNNTPLLHMVVDCQYIRMARLLLEEGAEFQGSVASHKGILLQEAVKRRDDQLARLLLEGRADVNAPPAKHSGLTALQAAAINGLKDLAVELLERGANVNAAPAKHGGFTALQGAINRGYGDLAAELLKWGADINAPSAKHGATALQEAVRCGYTNLAVELLERGADINAPPAENGATALQQAIRHGYTDFAVELLKRGANANAPRAMNGDTTLQEAVLYGHTDLAIKLFEHGADVNAPPEKDFGFTALQAAAIKGHIKIAIELLRRGAHVAAEFVPSHGRTAIDSAAENGRADILHLLLNHYDGDIDLVAVCKRAAGFAEKEGHVEIAQWLSKYPGV